MPQMEALMWLHLFIMSESLLLVMMCKLYYVLYKNLMPCKSSIKMKYINWLW